MRLIHERQQMPVGQGFCHFGTVALEGPITIDGPAFFYIYDCGSTKKRPLRRVISSIVQRLDGGDLDLLFLSHLDHDHVNGLDHLLVSCHTKCAVLPYLTPLQRLILIAKSVYRGTINASYLELLCDPHKWLSDRGIDRVLYVRSEPPPNNEPPDWTTHNPDDGPIVPSKRDRDEQTLELPQKLDLIVPSALGGSVIPRKTRHSKTEAHVISCLKPLRFQGAPIRSVANWQFVTFVHPEGERETKFRQAVQRTFGRQLVSERKFEIDQTKMMAILQCAADRERLASCYTVIRKNRNLTSLSVYSGPINLDGASVNNYSQLQFRSLRQQLVLSHRQYPNIQVAWIGTGDSNLSVLERRRAFMLHYESLRELVGTCALPHHGSRHNYHRELRSLAKTFTVSTGLNNKYDHPHVEVVTDIGEYQFVNITEDPRSSFYEQCLIV